MKSFLSSLPLLLFIPVAMGSVYSLLCVWAVRRFFCRNTFPRPLPSSEWPAVSVLKPVCGVEKNQRENLSSACRQDYPNYQVVFSVQDPGDPALPLLREIQKEFPGRVSVAVQNIRAGSNGKVNNLLGGLMLARHPVLVISDSDVWCGPEYLKKIIAPLQDPSVALVCTLYRATRAGRWFEKMELLTLNLDFLPSVVFAYVTGASDFCLGSSMAFRRRSLEQMGGLETVADYLAEDFEMGRLLRKNGGKMVLLPHSVDLVVDLRNISQWWHHQVAWDQKTKAARPGGFMATLLVRSIPFAVFFAALRPDSLGLVILGGAVTIRLAAAAFIAKWGFRDREGLRSLFLLPFRDVLALVTWCLAFTRKTVVWRNSKFLLTGQGRLKKMT